MGTEIYYRAIEVRQRTFSRNLGESKTRNLDAAKNHSGKGAQQSVRTTLVLVSKVSGAVNPTRRCNQHHPVSSDSISIGLVSIGARESI
jgi:hypothetical protein